MLEFWYDYASPYSWLASVLIRRHRIPVEYRPVYIRGLPTFSKGVPFSPAKLRYMMRDLERLAGRYNLPWRAPATFPVNGLYLLRLDLGLSGTQYFDAFHAAAFRAVWSEAQQVDTAEHAARVAAQAGVPAELAQQILQDDAIKARLRSETEAAVERGIFGLPTFVVNDELFWGHDRLSDALRWAGVAMTPDLARDLC